MPCGDQKGEAVGEFIEYPKILPSVCREGSLALELSSCQRRKMRKQIVEPKNKFAPINLLHQLQSALQFLAGRSLFVSSLFIPPCLHEGPCHSTPMPSLAQGAVFVTAGPFKVFRPWPYATHQAAETFLAVSL